MPGFSTVRSVQHFNSRPRVRAVFSLFFHFPCVLYFNSRPRVRAVRLGQVVEPIGFVISILALA